MKVLRVIAIILIMLLVISPVYADEYKYKELQEIAERIRIINFLNAVSLDDDQIEFVYEKSKQAERMREEAKAEIEKNYMDIIDAYRSLEQEVNEGRVVVDKETSKKFHYAKRKIEEIRKRLKENLLTLAKEIKSKLEPHQIYAIEQYVPCLIPRVQEGRIGQVEINKGLENLLLRIRSIPADVYNKRKEAIVERIYLKIERHLEHVAGNDNNGYREKIGEFLDNIRSMSDTDFMIKKDGILNEFKKSFNIRPKPKISCEQKIVRFLLSRGAVKLLDERIKRHGLAFSSP